MKNVKKIVICAVIVIAVIGAIVVKNKLSSIAKTANVAVTVNKTAVEGQNVKMSEKNSGDTYKANLEAYQQGIINSKISAKVVSISVENGQYINQGDTIATLDDQDIQNNINTAQAQLQINEQQLNSAQVSMEKLKINVDDAKRNYDRQKTLLEKEAISQMDFETAEKTFNTAQADYSLGNASIETSKANIEAQKVTIQKYQSDLTNTVIKSPISGVISDKALNIGQMASPGTVLAKVNDISSVYATIQVPQEKISSLKIGQAATVTVDGIDKTYDGVIQNMDLSADTSSRVFNCKIKIDNGDKSLLPGIFGKVQLISEQKTEIITVPINALVGSEGNYSVFINDNGKAKKQKITIGETDESNVEITSGVKDGDVVICSNIGSLQDGNEIEVTSKQDGGSEDTDNK